MMNTPDACLFASLLQRNVKYLDACMGVRRPGVRGAGGITSSWQIGQSFTPECQRFNRYSRSRLPGQVRASTCWRRLRMQSS